MDQLSQNLRQFKSQRGVEFRRWANAVLKEYILKGYAVNVNRTNQLGQIVQIMKRAENQLDAQQVLSVVESYSAALDMLDDYDHQTISKPKGNKATYVLSYDECQEVINKMKFASDSDLFGNEKDDSFKGSIGAIYQKIIASQTVTRELQPRCFCVFWIRLERCLLKALSG